MFPMTRGHPTPKPFCGGAKPRRARQAMRNIVERTAPIMAKLDLPTGPAELLAVSESPSGIISVANTRCAFAAAAA